MMKDLRCKHCDRPIAPGDSYMLHDNGMRRCLPFESGQAYGLEATPPTGTVEDPATPIPALGYDPKERS